MTSNAFFLLYSLQVTEIFPFSLLFSLMHILSYSIPTATGAVTNSLKTYGFPNALANVAIIAVATYTPTSAPTIISPGNIAAITVCGFLGVCGGFLILNYFFCRCCTSPQYYYPNNYFPEEQFVAVQPGNNNTCTLFHPVILSSLRDDIHHFDILS